MRWLVKPLLLLAFIAGVPLALFYLVPSSARVDHLGAARAAVDRRDFRQALEEFDKHLTRNPTDTEALILAARTARRCDDYAAADRYLESYLAAGGSSIEVELERAMRQSQEGQVEAAGGVLRFGTDNADHPAAPFMLEALARGLIKTGRLKLAKVTLDAWLDKPLPAADRAQGLVWKGEVFDSVNRSAEASELYKQALEVDPDHFDARFRLAEYLTAFDPQAALTHLELLERGHPDRPEVRLGLARCRRHMGDLEEADRLIARLLSDRPNDVLVVTEAGVIALDRGRQPDAENLLRKAVSLGPNDHNALVQLARCLQELGRDAEAREFRDRAAKLEEEQRRRAEELGR